MARALKEKRAASHGIMPDTPTQGPAGPSHDDIRMAARKMVELQTERENVGRKISAFRKTLKAEGFTLGVLDAIVKMLDRTPEEIKNHFAERDRYAEAMRFPVGSQLEFFGSDATSDAVKEQLKWKQIGFKDGVAGKGWANEPPKGCPPEAVQSYGAGHEEGQETVRRAFLEKQKACQAVKPVPSVELQPDEAEGSEDADDLEGNLDDAVRRLKRDGWANPAPEETSLEEAA